MLDIGWQELFFIAVLALIVVGPKDLPAAMRTIARAVGKARGLSREFQNSVSDMMREAELDELKRQVQQVQRFDVGSEIKNTLDPGGVLDNEFDPTGLDDKPSQPTANDAAAPPKAAAKPEKPENVRTDPPGQSGAGSPSAT